MVYTVTLNPALDYVVGVDNLRYDDINRATSEQLRYGGKGINVSVILSRLGVDNVALGFVAGFFGEKLDSMLRADGIRTDFVRLASGETRVNVKIRSTQDIDINANGPLITEDDIAQLFAKLDAVTRGDYVVLAGSVPSCVPQNIYQRIMARYADRGVHFVVDATGDLLRNVLPYKPFLVKPNHYELGDLFGVQTETVEDVLHYSHRLQDMGAVNVLVSRSDDGAVLLDADGACHSISNLHGEFVDSVGCGDSMVGGFIAGYMESGDYSRALVVGSACGNASAFSPELATRDEIMRALAEYERNNNLRFSIRE